MRVRSGVGGGGPGSSSVRIGQGSGASTCGRPECLGAFPKGGGVPGRARPVRPAPGAAGLRPARGRHRLGVAPRSRAVDVSPGQQWVAGGPADGQLTQPEWRRAVATDTTATGSPPRPSPDPPPRAAPTSRVIRTVAAAGGAEPEQRGRGRSPAPAPGPPPAGGRPTGRHCWRPQGRSTGPSRGQCTGRLSSTTKPMLGSLSVRSDATIWAMVVWEIPVDVAIQRPVQPK